MRDAVVRHDQRHEGPAGHRQPDQRGCRRPPAVSAVGHEHREAADGQRDEDRTDPVHPAFGASARFVGGNPLPREGDRDQADDRGEHEDRAVAEGIGHDAGEERIPAGHAAVDGRHQPAAHAEGRAADPGPQNHEAQTVGDVRGALQEPADDDDRQRAAQAQHRAENTHDEDADQHALASDVVTPSDQHDVGDRPGHDRTVSTWRRTPRGPASR